MTGHRPWREIRETQGALSAIVVGSWVQRQRRGVSHLVESVVSGDVITRCGKRMADEPNSNGGLELSGLDGYRCVTCVGR